ncbi:pyrimidine-nucleoside phosphorylase [Tepidibacter formicigenes]|jgi:pyrimidine-nucleoside phosphorylase|uniref:Pyrimidine-nucleoside phosphorylase n=1 Tax=Tepidibacter formicigenes DSM 15518 TaxID=1123349 RepID=A0A1M6L0R4_9FIRM|nr:pyrimidine-nucleoside phosphorylase [Tepidibacter formicigenes]SHJ64732.1 pyrimidine-nucleoside phosphorylase [Tepidibacter formicigenes DSM 15518]
MRMYDIIKKKRDGQELTKEEINFFVEGYSKGEIPDYQASALVMAIFLQKMTKEETVYLTEAMMNSGDVIDLSKIEGIKVDKHSTGGVGDKTTITLAPLVASCGAPVAKMSGRGLGHTGGTLDKLEAIPGLSIEMDQDKFTDNVNTHKIAVCGQTASIVPADKKLYALRDVTATVDNISLIASSIMSKKLASGADAIVLDVKTGSGAFMKELDDSFALAKEMVDIGNGMDRETIGVITDMDQPLGYAVGNALEVIEAIETLKGNGPKDFTELCLNLGSYMLMLAKVASNYEEGRKMLEEAISSGKALDKLREFIEIQGGNKEIVDNYDLLPSASNVIEVKAPKKGYVSKIEAETVGLSAMILGAGRETKEDELDLGAGIVLDKKVGDHVEEGETLACMYVNKMEKLESAKERLLSAYTISDEKPKERKLIYGVVTKEGIERF